jgi:hypothetical protein
MNRVTISIDLQDIELDKLKSNIKDACYTSTKITANETYFLMELIGSIDTASNRRDKYASVPTMFDTLLNSGVAYPLSDSVNILEKQDKALWSARRLIELQTKRIVDTIELEDGSYKNFNVIYTDSSKWEFVRIGIL